MLPTGLGVELPRCVCCSATYVKMLIINIARADVALLLVSAANDFVDSIAKGNYKIGELPGIVWQHSTIIRLLGFKQLLVAVTNMDSSVANYNQNHFYDIKQKVIQMLIKTGWKKEFIEECVPIIPIASNYNGDNLFTRSEYMPWWTGCHVKTLSGNSIHAHTLSDVFDKILPKHEIDDKPLRMAVTGLYRIKGIGDVFTGIIKQGKVNIGDAVSFIPTHNSFVNCHSTVRQIDHYLKTIDQAVAGYYVGINTKGVFKENKPRIGDVMVLKSDESLAAVEYFTALVQILGYPGKITVGDTFFGSSLGNSCSLLHITDINWKITKTHEKNHYPEYLKAYEIAQVTFKPHSRFVVDTYKTSDFFGSVIITNGNELIMFARVIDVTYRASHIITLTELYLCLLELGYIPLELHSIIGNEMFNILHYINNIKCNSTS